jgi:SAM-dependent methyltransferase
MSELTYVIKELWQGKSVARSFLNYRLSREVLRGKTIDIGGGKSAKYLSFMNKSDDVQFETFDIKTGDRTVDFETDQLPMGDNSFDTVLFLNVMEHIFNHQHIADEVVRITKPAGQLIGFVPFLVWYHPDHHDYFRYTHEALEKIFTKAHAKEIATEAIGKGPFIAAAQMMTLSVPKIVALPIAVCCYLLDTIFLYLRPNNTGKYALGYYFVVHK